MKTCVPAIGAASEVACACRMSPCAACARQLPHDFFSFFTLYQRQRVRSFSASSRRRHAPCAFYHLLPLSSAYLPSSILTFPSSLFLSMLLSLSLSLAFSNRFFASISAQWCPAAAVQYAICAFCICTILIHTRAIFLTLPRWPACILRVCR